MREKGKIETLNDVLTADTKDLIAYYNAHASNPVKRFSSRASAIKRVAALMQSISAPSASPQAIADTLNAPSMPPKSPEAMQKVLVSPAQSKAWQNPDVRAARCERSAVCVDGQDYPSVRAAFLELGLPMGKHIQFRGKLKEQGKMEAFGHTWEIIPINY